MKKIFLFLLLIPTLLGAQVTPTKIFVDNKYPAIEYRPSTFTNTKKYPIVFFYHGQSEVGTGTDASLSVLLNNKNHADLLINAEKYGFIVLAPQLVISFNSGSPGWRADYERRYFDHVMKSSYVDTNRMYATGLSLGGGGVWVMISDPVMSKRISSAVPICGTPQYECDFTIPAKNAVAVWAFHAKDDKTVSVVHSQNQVAFIGNSNPIVSPRLTLFDTGGHGIWGTVYKTDSVYKWMLSFKRGTTTPPIIVQPVRKLIKSYRILIYDNGDIAVDTIPNSTGSIPQPSSNISQIDIRTHQVIDITQARKRPENLFDGDTTTPALPDYFNGFILKETNGQVAWVVLDNFITTPRVQVFNGQYASGSQVDFQFYYDWTDTSRHSPVYSTTLPSKQWRGVDTSNSKLYADSSRLIRIRIADGAANNFTEVKVYAQTLGPAASILPSPAPGPPDEGKYFMGYGKVFNDTLMDDAGYEIRLQNDMGYIDTSKKATGKNLVLTKYGNSIELTYKPAVRNGRKIFPYFAGPRDGFKYPPSFNNDSKDIPAGADSAAMSSWMTTYDTYYAVAAKLGRNKNASLTGYSILSAAAGSGFGLIEEIEVGNEDDARWAGPLRFHNPHIKLFKLKQAYAGVKAADPSIKVISGALTAIDSSYMKAMYFVNLLRFKTKAVPFDIQAINEYATDAGGQHSGTSSGITPEQFRLYEKWKAFLSFRDRYYPGMPVYHAEFGYDVHEGSNYDVPAVAGQTKEQTKAYWYMRGMEADALARVSKIFQYTQRNIPGGDFSTTGFSYDTLLTSSGKNLPEYLHPFLNKQVLENGGWTSLPRDLYWFMTCRTLVLENYRAWPELIMHGDSTGVWIAKYSHFSNSNQVVYSIWLGSNKNLLFTNYPVIIPGAITATIVTPEVGTKQGKHTSLNVSNGTFRTTVMEFPQYILVTS